MEFPSPQAHPLMLSVRHNDAVLVWAPAKVNLYLEVLAKRDDGYHDLEVLAVSIVDPHDILELEAVPHPGGITFTVDGDTDLVPDGRAVLAGQGPRIAQKPSFNCVKIMRRLETRSAPS